MPRRNDLNRILVIGSGPIVIGQAAEFDYSGTQACKALKERGYEVILINSNPATIMTDLDSADRVYIEPITQDVVIDIIKRERPDGLLATLGGQTGLNMAVELSESGALAELGVELLGTSLYSIRYAEDRELFRQLMLDIGETIAPSKTVTTEAEALAFAHETGYPLIVRPAYTLGGTGGGAARDEAELLEIVQRGLKMSMAGQVLIEKSVAGWKEIEYEVVRDSADNCIVICTMENVDPVGIHTGDSIVAAPCQTLSTGEAAMLRAASLRIIRALKVEGGCNIQYALNPLTGEYAVIEVNPRLSRSSALASKATGYPIARVASQIAVGFRLDEIRNTVTGMSACIEPVVDYCVVKVPRWPFDKFVTATRTLGTQMKATGEVMAIGRGFEEALLKAIDSLDVKLNYHIGMAAMRGVEDERLRDMLHNPDHERIFAVSEAFARGYSMDCVHRLTQIDPYFLGKIRRIVELSATARLDGLSGTLLREMKACGFADDYIATQASVELATVVKMRSEMGLSPVYKMVDTCAGEFPAVSPYYYSTYDAHDEVGTHEGRPRVIVLGSGPIRIGQGIEFDYCSVHSALSLRRMGMEAVIINSNPETVSTDFDTSDRLYFEPLTAECVLDIIGREKPQGVVVQFGGQTALNLTARLRAEGVNVLGTAPADIDRAEDRELFLQTLGALGIPLPPGGTAYDVQGALNTAKDIGYPVIVRPSYVLGGRAMEIVYNDAELADYMTAAVDASPERPVLIDRYIVGREAEADLICDGEDVLIPGLMEHVERAGVHSGDSIAIYPPQTLSAHVQERMVDYATRIAKALRIKGLLNIQFVLDGEDVYVLEANPRASRTVPILSKVTGVRMVDIATRVMMGQSLKEQGLTPGLCPPAELITVKAPVFSFSKMTTVDTFLGPEMKSTGEVMGTAKTFDEALCKALLASGVRIPLKGTLLFSLANRDKDEGAALAKAFSDAGYAIAATEGTHKHFSQQGLSSVCVPMRDAQSTLRRDAFAMIVNTPTRGKLPARDGFKLRRLSMEFNVPCVTSLDTAGAIRRVLPLLGKPMEPIPLNAYR